MRYIGTHITRALAAAAALVAAPAAAQDARPAERSPAAFWEALGGTTLPRLIDRTLQRNHDVRAADARVRGARAERLGAALDLAPAVTATGGFTRQRLATRTIPGAAGSLPDQNLWDAGLRLSWEVDVFGRTRGNLRGQAELVDAAAEDRRDVQVLLAAEVADAYFALRGAQHRLAVARRNAENQRGTLDVTVQRLEGGSGTALDTERARAQLSATLAEIPALEAEIDQARSRIGVLAARDASAVAPALEADAPPIALPEAPTVESIEAVVRRRPDVRSAERQVAARAAFVGAAKADYLPRLSIGGGAGYTSSDVESLGNTGTPRYAFGPVVTWPALDFGRVKAGVDAARAGEAEARARHEQATLRARAEIESSLVAYRKARERVQHLDDAARASERAAELARLRYTEGASDFLQVLDAERTLLAAQDRQALGRTQAIAALVAVHRALGGSWPREGAGAP